ncbi:MAG TPA: GxxExxY protein [Ignavibacteria bacterium]|nr:GxxExxY protein [Ignavibacteria bacterium]
MTENELAKIVIDLCFKIHKTLGPGLLESVYESALFYELDLLGIPYERQKDMPVPYRDTILDVGFRTDVIVESKLIVEIKSIENLLPVHHKIVITYLRIAEKKLGLLINFNVNLLKDGIFRKVNGL